MWRARIVRTVAERRSKSFVHSAAVRTDHWLGSSAFSSRGEMRDVEHAWPAVAAMREEKAAEGFGSTFDPSFAREPDVQTRRQTATVCDSSLPNNGVSAG